MEFKVLLRRPLPTIRRRCRSYTALRPILFWGCIMWLPMPTLLVWLRRWLVTALSGSARGGGLIYKARREDIRCTGISMSGRGQVRRGLRILRRSNMLWAICRVIRSLPGRLTTTRFLLCCRAILPILFYMVIPMAMGCLSGRLPMPGGAVSVQHINVKTRTEPERHRDRYEWMDKR